MNPDAVGSAARAHPEIVGGDGADLGDLNQWRDALADLVDRVECLERVAARDEILGLQFLAGAGGETHSEMGQALVPRTRRAHLLGAMLGGGMDQRVNVPACRRGAGGGVES